MSGTCLPTLLRSARRNLCSTAASRCVMMHAYQQCLVNALLHAPPWCGPRIGAAARRRQRTTFEQPLRRPPQHVSPAPRRRHRADVIIHLLGHRPATHKSSSAEVTPDPRRRQRAAPARAAAPPPARRPQSQMRACSRRPPAPRAPPAPPTARPARLPAAAPPAPAHAPAAAGQMLKRK